MVLHCSIASATMTTTLPPRPGQLARYTIEILLFLLLPSQRLRQNTRLFVVLQDSDTLRKARAINDSIPRQSLVSLKASVVDLTGVLVCFSLDLFLGSNLLSRMSGSQMPKALPRMGR